MQPKVLRWYDKPAPAESVTGSGKEPKYRYTVDSTGRRKLIQDGYTDVHALIQSSLDETKIESIIRRAAYDPTALGTPWTDTEGSYTDLTALPETYHEWREAMEAGQAQYNALPAEIKAKFGNSVDSYMSELGSESWASKIGILHKDESALDEGACEK